MGCAMHSDSVEYNEYIYILALRILGFSESPTVFEAC